MRNQDHPAIEGNLPGAEAWLRTGSHCLWPKKRPPVALGQPTRRPLPEYEESRLLDSSPNQATLNNRNIQSVSVIEWKPSFLPNTEDWKMIGKYLTWIELLIFFGTLSSSRRSTPWCHDGILWISCRISVWRAFDGAENEISKWENPKLCNFCLHRNENKTRNLSKINVLIGCWSTWPAALSSCTTNFLSKLRRHERHERRLESTAVGFVDKEDYQNGYLG